MPPNNEFVVIGHWPSALNQEANTRPADPGRALMVNNRLKSPS